jgi:hypothetical protein
MHSFGASIMIINTEVYTHRSVAALKSMLMKNVQYFRNRYLRLMALGSGTPGQGSDLTAAYDPSATFHTSKLPSRATQAYVPS